MDVLPANVRNELLVAELLAIEDQKLLARLYTSTKFFRPEKQTQLKRHIESGKSRIRVWLGLRNIVNAVTTLTNNSNYFINSNLTAVVILARASGIKPRALDRKDYCLEVSVVVSRKRTIDKDVVVVQRLPRRALATALRTSFALKCVAEPLGFRIGTPSFVVPSTPSTLRYLFSELAPSRRRRVLSFMSERKPAAKLSP